MVETGIHDGLGRGLTPLISSTGAPAWAEGTRRPTQVPAGTWRPDAAAFGQFARALARRYDGTYPDPLVPGSTLPKVTAFQPWNEPNLNRYLAPQWVKRGNRFTAESPVIYRNLQNAFTRGIRSAQPAATVVTAGTAPYGDPQAGGNRIMPVRFWRNVLCLNAALQRVKRCGPVGFDAFSHHPYSVGGPRRKALNRDDVSVPDLGKLTRLVKAAERAGTAPGRHRYWVTEISWDSGPDDPDGVSERTQATWLAESFMILWRQGVDTITWLQVRDQPGPDFPGTAQAGTYRFNGRPKLSAQAFRFPVAIDRSTKTIARVWLRSPAQGPITLQVRRGGRWADARTVNAGRHSVVEVSVPLRNGTAIRAKQGELTSLAASVR